MKLKRYWKTIKLRLSLFRIWFMKNLLLFLRVAAVLCLIGIFTGVITSETPILGAIVYPIFSPLADEINKVIAEKEIEGLMTFLSVVTSVLFTISMFTVKLKSIVKSDIKNDKLKYALIQANLYFNSDGRLVKKVEKATGEDINGDGKIDAEDAVDKSDKKGIIKGIIGAFQEFNTIMKADLEDNEETSAYDKAVKDAGLEKAEEATEEIVNIIEDGTRNFIADKANIVIDNEIEEIENDEKTPEEEKKVKISVFERIRNWYNSFRNRKKEEKEDDAEILVDNMNIDSEIDDITEPISKETNTDKVKESKTKSSEQDFLEKLRNRNK